MIDRSNKANNETGAALIAVTWVILLISLMAVAVMDATKVTRFSVDTVEQEIRSELMTKSVMDLFMHRYFYTEAEGFFTRGTINILDRDFSISVEHEAGKININRADFDTLSLIFAAAGEDEDTSKSIAGAIIDWRDANSDAIESYGAEADAYAAANLDYQPRNGAFESVGELIHVLGMTSNLFECVVPTLTVYSLSSNVDGARATPEVREVLKFANDQGWAGRAWPDPEAAASTLSLNSFAGRALTIKIAANDDASFSTERTIRFKSAIDRSYAGLTPIRKIYARDKRADCPW